MADERWYLRCAAACVRGHRQVAAAAVPSRLLAAPFAELTDEDCQCLCEAGIAAGLRLHACKRTTGLPRVTRVIGTLMGLAPTELLDVGSGRGVFLWPLLEALPSLVVTSIDLTEQRVARIWAVGRGGLGVLTAARASVQALPFRDGAFDVVTALEVLEHVVDAAAAASELVRAARRFVVVSVPSRGDDNPEHVRLFDRDSLVDLLSRAGAARVRVDYVLNHIVAVARCR